MPNTNSKLMDLRLDSKKNAKLIDFRLESDDISDFLLGDSPHRCWWHLETVCVARGCQGCGLQTQSASKAMEKMAAEMGRGDQV